MKRFTRKRSSIALPWERRGTLLERVAMFRRVRFIVLVVALVWGTAKVWEFEHTHDAINETRVTLAAVHQAVRNFRSDIGRCPQSIDELVGATRGGATYLRERPIDAWGRPIYVSCPGRFDPNDADVVSAGPQGSFFDDDNVM